MGPPVATLEQGKYALTPELSISNNDIGPKHRLRHSDIAINTLLARLSYGYREDVELFARTGIGFGSMTVPITIGAGAKWTFYKNEEFPLGLIFQTHWLPGQSFSEDYDLLEFQIAAGTMYRYEKFDIYGGPFLHFLRGEEDIDTRNLWVLRTIDNDVEEESILGVYAGVRKELTEKISVDFELQLTSDAYGFAAGLPWSF
jgi:hypothetical protein